MPFTKQLEVSNFKHWGKIMDSVEHNGFVHEWKHFSPTSKKLEKGSYVGDTATYKSVLERNSQQ